MINIRGQHLIEGQRQAELAEYVAFIASNFDTFYEQGDDPQAHAQLHDVIEAQVLMLLRLIRTRNGPLITIVDVEYCSDGDCDFE